MTDQLGVKVTTAPTIAGSRLGSLLFTKAA